MTLQQAKAYLDSYNDGTLGHDIFDRDSFIFKRIDGTYGFYHGPNQALDSWEWSKDIQELKNDPDYYDNRGGEKFHNMMLTTGGIICQATKWILSMAECRGGMKFAA